MRSIKEQLAVVYCLVDDGLKSEKNGGDWRKSNHKPKCTDAEIIAVAMMQSYLRQLRSNELIYWLKPMIHRLFRICRVTNNGSPDGIN